MQTALITGVNGFCGQHLARRLSHEGSCRLVGLDVSREPPVGVPMEEYVCADVGNATDVARVVERTHPDLIFHLAGIMIGECLDVYRVNVLGGIHLLEAVRRFAPQARVLVVGSAAEYGNVSTSGEPIAEECCCRPQGTYAVSKYALTLAALDYARRCGMKVVVARPFNIVGAGIPDSLVVGAILRRAKAALSCGGDTLVRVGNLNTERDFIDVEDVVQAYIQMVRGEQWGEVFNICSGKARTVRSVVEQLLSFSPRPIRLGVDPALVRPSEVQTIIGSWHKANRWFGFQPHSNLDVALRSAWDCVMGEGISTTGRHGP